MIVITAPTGQIGRQLLDRMLDVEEPVRVIARDPARLPADVRARVEVVPGSHGDSEPVTKAFAGADRVFWLVPPDPSRTGSLRRYYLDFTRPACQAITAQGVQRVVGVSTLGHGYRGKAGLLSAALAMDELVESTGVSYRSLAMPFFMENLLRQARQIWDQGTFSLPNAAGRPLPTVATRDIAAAAAALLLDRTWSGQASVPVASPDDLTPVGLAEVISDVLGRTVSFRQIPVPDYRAMLLRRGLGDATAQDMVDMVEAQNDGIYDAEFRDPRSAAPTSFRQWCQDTLKPAVQP